MKPIFLLLIVIHLPFFLIGHTKNNPKVKPNLLSPCNPSQSQTELNINNVRARLLGGGDMWWDGKSVAKYVIPKTKAGQPEVSALFAGGLWIGGRDKVGNIKLAASTYRDNGTDFWPGPLDPIDGITDLVNCNNWDRHFTVFGSNIKAHINNYSTSIKNGTNYLEQDIPDDVKAWPCKGNPFFEKTNGFKLPANNGGLAPFFDNDGDDIYNPLNGDYPILSGFKNDNYYADQMIFWIINDNGNVHTLSKGSEPIQIEIQNMAYAFLTNDYVINNTTFYSSKIINKGIELIRDTYLGLWTDPDLGCGSDDMIGCDTTRSLMYVYNGDAVDGSSGCNCGTTPTYCNDIPMVGIDILNGGKVIQIDSTGNPFDTVDGKMNSFTYFTNNFEGPSGNDPITIFEYYNYLSGKWNDGTRYTYGGTGYNPSSTNFINYVFTDEPCNPAGWSMASLGFPGNDFRTLQTSGPFSILSGQTREISYSVVFAPKVNHPKPCLNALRDADDRVQIFFDELFGKYHCDICPGPDAPDLITLPKNQSITFSFFNNENSNNQNLDHLVYCKYASLESMDPNYHFEGYKVFQLKENILDLGNSLKSKLVFQCDLKNSIKDIYSFTPNLSSNGQPNSWNKIPYIQNSSNNGIPQSFTLSYDAFTGKKLENGKTYYYSVVAYDYNNYEEFNTVENYGQRQQYFEGSRNIKVYSVSPQRGEKYLVEPIVTRLEGEGTGSNILQISSIERESILKNTNDGKVAYNLSTSPLQLLIIDPEKCNGKQFQISIVDSTLNDTILSSSTRWKLTNLTNNNSIIAKNRITDFNEELLDSFGIILRVEQAIEPGEFVFFNSNNGFRGVKISYNSLPFNWYESIGDGFVNTNNGKINSPNLKFFNVENDLNIDPYLAYTKSNNLFYPFGLMNFRGNVVNNNNLPYFTTGWMLENTFGYVSRAPISKLNNVDIVLTPDKSKWSRCVIVETANTFYTSKMNINSSLSKYYLDLETKPNPDGKFPSQFDLRGDFSVGKNDQNGDGKPDPDGAVDANGKPLYGMGWFPGYAVDIETGKRLNIYFGENSCYSEKYDSICKKDNQIGGDMLWNPNGTLFTGDTLPNGSAYNYFAGGQHFIYVTNQTYDSCASIRKALLNSNKATKTIQLKNNTWTSIPMPLKALKPLGAGSKGLIPSECVIKLRVNNAYQVKNENGINNGYPTYLLDFKNRPIVADNFKTEFVSNNLSNVLFHPNPYFPSKHSTLNMSNLPENSQIEIYNLSGNLLLSQKASKQFSWDHKLQNGNLLNTSILLVKITNLDDKSYEIKKVMVE